MRRLSTGTLFLASSLAVPAGTPVEIQVEGFDRVLRARFIEAASGGAYLQLPLNHDHLSYMSQMLGRLGLKDAA